MFRRRDFLMTMSALPWLPGLLQGAPLLRKSNRSLIVLWMDGGMSHIDTFDGKPEARPDIRGELVSRESSLEGVFLSEHLPRLAGNMDEFAFGFRGESSVRGLVKNPYDLTKGSGGSSTGTEHGSPWSAAARSPSGPSENRCTCS